jgi:membrane-associated phospholipid phosphatase
VTAAATVEDAPFGPAVAAFDAAVDRGLDRLRGHPVADRVFYTASALGDWSLLWHLIGLGRAALDPAWRRDGLRLSTVLAAESLTVNQGVKRLFKRRRPAVETDDRPHNLRIPTTTSFPSGHASAAFCAAVLLSDGDRALAPLWYGLATVVALSRPYARDHHASDTVAGALLGFTIGQVGKRLWRR